MTAEILSREVFDELGDVVGRERLMRLRERFVAGLRTAFDGPERGSDDVAREAHTLISMAGMLGCERLSQACRALERTAKAGEDLAQPLADIRALRDRTIEALEAVGPARA